MCRSQRAQRRGKDPSNGAIQSGYIYILRGPLPIGYNPSGSGASCGNRTIWDLPQTVPHGSQCPSFRGADTRFTEIGVRQLWP